MELTRDAIKDLIREVLAEDAPSDLGGLTDDRPWLEVLNTVDWLAFVRDIKTGDLAFWPDLCFRTSEAIRSIDLSASPSLQLVADGIERWLVAEADSTETHPDVNWSGWLDALETYLVEEDAEPGEFKGVTFAEFCEALASTIQVNLCRGGLHTWVSPAEHTGIGPRPNMQKVVWFIALVLWRIPEWLGEGLRPGEKNPIKYPDGGGSGWSQSGS